jgi:hypothetical protein
MAENLRMVRPGVRYDEKPTTYTSAIGKIAHQREDKEKQ